MHLCSLVSSANGLDMGRVCLDSAWEGLSKANKATKQPKAHRKGHPKKCTAVISLRYATTETSQFFWLLLGFAPGGSPFSQRSIEACPCTREDSNSLVGLSAGYKSNALPTTGTPTTETSQTGVKRCYVRLYLPHFLSSAREQHLPLPSNHQLNAVQQVSTFFIVRSISKEGRHFVV